MSGTGSRRWLVESAVIVGSILLAFALDAGWGAWTREREFEGDLVDLRREFVDIVAETTEAARLHRLVESGSAKLRDDLAVGEAGRSVPVSSRALALSVQVRAIEIEPGSVSAFIAAGGLDVFDDDADALRLQRWPAEVADLREGETALSQRTEERYYPVVFAAGDLRGIFVWPPPSGMAETVELEVSDELRNWVSWRVLLEGFAAGRAVDTCRVAVEIIASIDRRLGDGPTSLPEGHCEAPERMTAWMETA